MANTLAPLSEVGIASMAAGLLDDYHIASLDEDRPIVRFMAREFGYVRDEILQSYPWHFAKTRAVLAPESDAPAFGYSYSYVIPTDCVRLLALRYNGNHNGGDVLYEVESGKILCNVSSSLNVIYIKRESNVAKWSPLAARAFAARLAMYAATRVTGKMQYFQKAQAEFQAVMFEARVADSLERGTPESTDYKLNSLTVRGSLYGTPGIASYADSW